MKGFELIGLRLKTSLEEKRGDLYQKGGLKKSLESGEKREGDSFGLGKDVEEQQVLRIRSMS